MKEEKETRQKLLASAKSEFLEKGYLKASLRNICKNAGVTTGALYFFFEDKEDLFGSLVEEPLHTLIGMMTKHYEVEEKGLKSDFSEDYETARMLLHFMYLYYDEFQLMLTKSQGSKYEFCVEQCIQITEQHYKRTIEQIEKTIGRRIMDDYTIHWFSHMTVDIFVNLLKHEPCEEAAIEHMEQIVKYQIEGWKGMVSESNVLQG